MTWTEFAVNELTELLIEATCRIAKPYFHVPIDGGDPVYRERVYCYELYHQLRCLWPESSELLLNGELNKSGHQKLRQLGADRMTPDFLVHMPGHMSSNHAIIEVKRANASPKAIRKDLNTLARFRTKVATGRTFHRPALTAVRPGRVSSRPAGAQRSAR